MLVFVFRSILAKGSEREGGREVQQGEGMKGCLRNEGWWMEEEQGDEREGLEDEVEGKDRGVGLRV